MTVPELSLPLTGISEVCRRYHVRELSIFGSTARGEARPDSDVDFLVDFEPDAKVGLLAYAGLSDELAQLVGRHVDLVAKQGLKSMIRDAVLSEARIVYAA